MNFKELTNLIAKGISGENNACIIGVAIDAGDNLDITGFFDGGSYNTHSIIQFLVENYLSPLDDETASFERDCLIKIIEEDKQRRIK